MIEFLTLTPDEVALSEGGVGSTLRKFNTSLLLPQEEGGSFGEAFKASFLRDNATIALIEAASSVIDQSSIDNLPGDFTDDELRTAIGDTNQFNVFTHLKETLDPEELEALDFFIRRGIFDGLTSPEAADARIQRIQLEQTRLSAIEGNAFGAFLGSFATVPFDLSTYVPLLGVTNRIRLGGRTLTGLARGATFGLAAGAIPEVALQSVQDLRTAQESFLNIGIGGVLGGGIGAFAKLVVPGHPLHPANADNLLRAENVGKQGAVFRNTDGTEDVIAHADDLQVQAANDDAGGLNRAAGAAGAPEAPRAAPGITDKIPGLRKATDKILGVTPAGRALQYKSNVARGVMLRLMDLGGLLTDTARYGQRLGPSAEDVKRDIVQMGEGVILTGQSLWRTTNQDLGELGVGRSLFGVRQKQLSASAFNVEVQRILTGTFDDVRKAGLIEQFGEDGAKVVVSKATQFSEAIHTFNGKMELELLDVGILRNPEKIVAFQAKIDEAKLAIEANKTAEVPLGSAETRALREELEASQADFRLETAKAEALGRDFGHAQLWDEHTIQARSAEYEDFIIDILVESPDNVWLADGFDMSVEDFAKLKDTDPALRTKILREWVGDEKGHNETQAEKRLDAAGQELEQAQFELSDALREAGATKRRVGGLTISQSRKFRDKVAAENAANKRLVELVEAEERELIEAATASRTRTLTRQEQFDDVRPDTGIDSFKRFSKAADNGDQTRIDLGDADAPSAAPVRDTVPLARSEERTAGLNRRARDARRKFEASSDQLKTVDARLKAVDDRLAAQKKQQKALAEIVGETKAGRRAAKTELSKAERASLKARRATPLMTAVEDLVHRMGDTARLPTKIADTATVTTGRVKERRLRLTKEQQLVGQEKGFLRNDLGVILTRSFNQLGGQIGLNRSFGLQKGAEFEDWASVRRAISDDFDGLINRASGREVVALRGQKDNALKDANGLRDRLMGMADVGLDRDGWPYWLSTQVRKANFNRFGGGFLPSSFTDVATFNLTTGSLMKVIKENLRDTIKIMKTAKANNPSEFLNMSTASEYSQNGIRVAQAFDVEDAIGRTGVGPEGSLRRRITGAIDRSQDQVADKVSLVSGVRHWNRMWKIMNGIYRAKRVADVLPGYDKLTPNEKAEWASLGIGKEEAAKIVRMLKKHSSSDGEFQWDPGLEKWAETPEGREIARTYRIAIERDMARGIMSPGIGDTPLIMSKEAGKMFFQFQTFAFTFINRFVAPASQRLTAGDAQALVSYGHLVWSASLVVVAKDLIRGKDPLERLEDDDRWAQTAVDVVDRMGLLGASSPFVSGALKAPFGDGTVGSQLLGIQEPSRFVRQEWWQPFLGTGFGLGKDAFNFAGSVSSGDVDQIKNKGFLLMPLNTQFRIGNQLLESAGVIPDTD